VGLKEDAVIRTVQELRSILSCSSEDIRTAVIRPLHLTLPEFLVDEKRCTDAVFCIDRHAWHNKFAKACLGTLNSMLHRNMFGWSNIDSFESEEERRSLIQELVPAHVRYACNHWVVHLVANEPTSDPILAQLLEEFCRRNLLPWIEVQNDEVQNYANDLDKAQGMLWDLHSWAKVCVILRCGFNLLKHRVPSGTRGFCAYFDHSP
jgi:hypothetical protein